MALRGVVGRGAVLLVVVSTLTGFLTGLASLALALTVTEFNDGLLRAASCLSLALLIAAPAAGGVVSGLIAEYVAGEVRGHGTDAVIRAILLKEGFIRARAPLAKLAATVSTVGSGGSGGVVAPVIFIGASLGASITKFLTPTLINLPVPVNAVERVEALLSGACRVPLAAVALSVEVTRCPALIPPSILTALISYLIAGPGATIYRSQEGG